MSAPDPVCALPNHFDKTLGICTLPDPTCPDQGSMTMNISQAYAAAGQTMPAGATTLQYDPTSKTCVCPPGKTLNVLQMGMGAQPFYACQ